MTKRTRVETVRVPVHLMGWSQMVRPRWTADTAYLVGTGAKRSTALRDLRKRCAEAIKEAGK